MHVLSTGRRLPVADPPREGARTVFKMSAVKPVQREQPRLDLRRPLYFPQSVLAQRLCAARRSRAGSAHPRVRAAEPPASGLRATARQLL